MHNAIMPYDDWQFIGEVIENSRWIYAKTMPQNPHYYMLRKETLERTGDDVEFVKFVELIRKYGYRYKFGKSWYTQLNVNNWYYWTMGCPLHNCPKTGTILINRKERRLGLESPYDVIIPDTSDIDLISHHDLSGKILEIGCGCGLTARGLNKELYTGIDPADKMLEQFPEGFHTINTDFESFCTKDKYRFIYATHGAASYVRPEFWSRLKYILEPGGTFLLMFYSHGSHYTVEDFPASSDTEIRTVGKYTVVEGNGEL